MLGASIGDAGGMGVASSCTVMLLPYAEEDLPLTVELETDPEVMAELGGSTPEEEIPRVHRKRMGRKGPGDQWLKIVPEGDGPAVGVIGIWPAAWQGSPIHEAGWMILPRFQGQGFARRALAELLTAAREASELDSVHAFPGVTNLPSNSLCRSAGFELIEGDVAVEYAGRELRCNHWGVELSPTYPLTPMVLSADAEAVEKRLTGGHPNSLGNTIEVVEDVLADSRLVAPLLEAYDSEDEVVRLRVSSAVKRVTEAHPEWMLPHLGRLQGDIAQIDQASTKWTQPKLYLALWDLMDEGQRERSKEIVRRNLEADDDWIVQNNSIEALAIWAGEDRVLREWLSPRLELRTEDCRKSVAKRASKALEALTATDRG